MAWVASRPLNQASVEAVLRADSNAGWGAQTTLASGAANPLPAALSINDAGQAALLYSDLTNPTTGARAVYAVTR